MTCRNLCDILHSKIIVGKSHYDAGKKYCRRCEVFLYHNGTFCPCCGMALRATPTSRRDKEKTKTKSKIKTAITRAIKSRICIVKALTRNINEVNAKQKEAAKAFEKGTSGQ